MWPLHAVGADLPQHPSGNVDNSFTIDWKNNNTNPAPRATLGIFSSSLLLRTIESMIGCRNLKCSSNSQRIWKYKYFSSYKCTLKETFGSCFRKASVTIYSPLILARGKEAREGRAEAVLKGEGTSLENHKGGIDLRSDRRNI